MSTIPKMTEERIHVNLWSFTDGMDGTLADFLHELRAIHTACPEGVVPTIEFHIASGYDEDEIRATVSYPRMETQDEAERRAQRESYARADRLRTYEKLKAEFEPNAS